MFTKKTSMVTILGIIFMLCCLVACGSDNKEYLSSLDIAVEQKLQTAIKLFESGDLKATVTYCEKEEKITTQSETRSLPLIAQSPPISTNQRRM